ncbi:MAG: aminopeptidase P family protein [Gammaproteobacteria bacterium]|nr:aminopeptidase P family protein [Gammaproteobacteria bacterium]
MLIKSANFSTAALDRFREYQRLSFSILEQMAGSLQPGMTEKEVARALVCRFKEYGVNSFFHLPVVLFGERTALPGEWRLSNFFPKSRALQVDDSVILDAAPLFDGYLVDTSYSFCFGESPVHRKMMADLAHFRSDIRTAVNNGKTFKSIADNVNRELLEQGYQPVHTKHPGEVLGHRALKTINLPFAWRLQGFDAMSLSWFISKSKMGDLGLRTSPLWNNKKSSNHPPQDGLWLVEPHAGAGVTGAKWEEILVIQNGQAEWLDQEPPHLQQWASIARNRGYGPRALHVKNPV